MKYWTEGSHLRRDDNSHNEIPLPAFQPHRASSCDITADRSDLVLCSGGIEVPRNTSGYWGHAMLFMSREEVSIFIDFLVQDKEIFAELFQKVFHQSKLNMDIKSEP
jgi:hypothetical protein